MPGILDADGNKVDMARLQVEIYLAALAKTSIRAYHVHERLSDFRAYYELSSSKAERK